MKRLMFIIVRDARTDHVEWVLTRYGAAVGLALVSLASGILALIAGSL
jgi:hypothetical protein